MSDDDEPGALVIHLFGPPPAVEGAPEAPWSGKGCYPHWPIVDRALRAVTCKRCDANLDPVEVLLDVASKHAEWQRLIGETSTMRAQLATLQKDEKLTRERTKSLARKDAAEAVAAERAKLERQRFEVMTRTDDIRRALQRIDQLMGKPTPRQARRRRKV
jgi:hypothetical protein